MELDDRTISRILRAFGFFSWGKGSWIHESDEGWVMDTATALEVAASGAYRKVV